MTRRLFPTAATETDWARRYHHDLSTLPAEHAWAEQTLLTHWLAEQVFCGHRPAHIFDDTTDQAWARERLRRLRAVLSGRRAA